MEHIKLFEEHIEETETSNYEVPKFIVKPYPGDTGYELTRKRYHRFLWVLPNLGKGSIDKGEDAPVTEGAYGDLIDKDSFSPAEVSGMGRSQETFPHGDTVGYTKDTGTDYLPTDAYEDPDEKKAKKLKTIKDFKEFIDGDTEEEK
jgi:hypothetical protein